MGQTLIDLSLSNEGLYRGLEGKDLAGSLTLLSDPESAVPLLLSNLSELSIDPEEVVLTGRMAIWAYLVVFHHLHGRTKRIYYEDGRGQRILIAAHG